MTDAAFGAKLHIFTSDLSEGFFGKKVVLVEGRSDKALLKAALTLKERTATSEGLTIIPVGGKTVLDKPAFIFQTLKIPTYVIFDNDQKTKEKEKPAEIIYNRFLQRLLGYRSRRLLIGPLECTSAGLLGTGILRLAFVRPVGTPFMRRQRLR
jgi:predicted ATP-dependent endonuclease of OLD family